MTNLSSAPQSEKTLEVIEKLATEEVTIGRRSDWDKEGIPSFCRRLIEHPLPFLKTCKRDSRSMTCVTGETMMFSQFHQDFYVYKNHFAKLNRPGVYLDIATNDPVSISNTYFMDRCLRWKGVCVEANPDYHEKIYRMRSCELLPTCVGRNDGEHVEFGLRGGDGGVLGDSYKHTEKLIRAKIEVSTLKRRCTTMGKILYRLNVDTVDYMSLDVEGHELKVLQGFDWSRTKVHVMTIEVTPTSIGQIEKYLNGQGYVRHMPKHDERSISTGLLMEDAIFLHGDVVFGSPE